MILLDTDVILDVVLDRAPHAEASSALLDRLQRRPYRAFVSWHTLSNLYYMLRPDPPRGDVRAFLRDLTRLASVTPTNTDDFRFAASLPIADLEDAMQVAAAEACGVRWIATRNIRDYRHSPVPARTPAELLEELG